jgi:hypothetical protein
VKRPVGITAITVPSVGVITGGGDDGGVIVGGLQTTSGPTSFEGRHAILILTRNQAEALVYELADKLGMEVTA